MKRPPGLIRLAEARRADAPPAVRPASAGRLPARQPTALRTIPLLLGPFLLVLGVALPCAAEVQVSLPLQGHYRAGRYMPVRVVARGEPAGELTLSADGAVATTVQFTGGSADAVVPLLVVHAPLGPVSWSLPDGRGGTVATGPAALGEQDRLVGFAGGDAGAAGPLFPGKTVVPLPLDIADPLHGPLAAWESLDAVVLDRAPESDTTRLLAAGGTAVVVRSAAQPEADVLPWRRAGDAWVMSHDPLGPRGAIAPEAYDPTYGWHPGRGPETRRQVVLIAVLFSVLAVAATLWRSRLALVAILGVCAAAGGALAFRASRLSPVVVARGDVFARRGEALQWDQWTFYKSVASASEQFYPGTMARPVFASAGHFQRARLRLWCTAEGHPLTFTFPLAPQTAMVFLTRRAAAPSDERPDPAAGGSPLWPLVRGAYLRPGVRAAGEVGVGPADGAGVQQEQWPGVVVVDESTR